MADILVVDDDPAIRKVLRIGLERSGHRVLIKEDGREAVDFLQDQADTGDPESGPECILLDIRMPRLSGLEVLEFARRNLPRIPVIMLTARNDLDTAMDTIRKGAFDFLDKPVRRPLLMGTIDKALSYRATLLENERLARENREYQRSLEQKVSERTVELRDAYRKLKKTNMDTVRVLAETIEAKDHYTRGHSQRVRLLALELARHLNLSDEEREFLEYASLLHDIGKIGISESLLNKGAALTADEVLVFRQHPVIGENIVRMVDFFAPCLPAIRQHHERWDGTGYPDGLRGRNVDLGARIILLVDSYDAMTSTRPYRKALPVEKAIEEMERGRGTQFDPELLDLFIQKEIYKVIQ